MAQKKGKKKTATKPARRMVVDHELLEKLCRQFVKPKTIIRHYRTKTKGKRNQPTATHLTSLITIIKGSVPKPTRKKTILTDAPEKYQVFLEHQGKRMTDAPYSYPDHYNKTTPRWAKTAQGVLNPPLKEVKDLQARCEKQCANAINEIIALKKALVKANAKQEKYEKRLKKIEEFNKSESTITITEWLLE